jgi:CubicO group peptidase (beta-lactamase class C family)
VRPRSPGRRPSAASTSERRAAAGLSIAVARGDEVILSKGYGKADLEHGVVANEATVFRIASVTKQFTAAAIMRLVEQGKLALDDDFTKYIDYPTQGRTVTIRHLLTHTSGIRSYTDVPGFFETGTTRDLPPAAVLDPVRKLPFDFEPGTKWAYSNTNYHLLGMIIEKVSGVPYAKHMQDEFFTPLHLTRTRYDVRADVIPGRAPGYDVINGAPANASYLSMTIPFSAGGLLSTAGDLVQWQLDLIGGKVVSPESYLQMTTPAKLSDGSTTRHGFGLFLSDVDGHPNFMHEGAGPGFNSILVYFTNEKLSIAVLSNSPAASAGLLAAEIAREAFGIKAPG